MGNRGPDRGARVLLTIRPVRARYRCWPTILRLRSEFSCPIHRSMRRFSIGLRAVNEFEHHLTSRLHPAGLRPADGDTALLADIVADAARCGLTNAVKRGLVIAARNALADTPRRIATAH